MKNYVKNMFRVTQHDGMDAETFCWAVFPAKWDDEKIFSFIDWAEYRYDMMVGIGRDGYHGGAGQGYSNGAVIKRSKTRALVVQRHGLDV